MQEACYQLKNKELGFNNYRLMFEELPLEELLREGRRWAGWVYEITSWVWGITAWGSQMSRLSLWNHWLGLRNYRLRNYRLRFGVHENYLFDLRSNQFLFTISQKSKSKECMMSGNLPWVCICVLEGSHFPFMDADPRMTGLALRIT